MSILDDIKLKQNLTINRTPALGCPDCENKTQHLNKEMFKKYHPHAGEGFYKEHGVFTLDKNGMTQEDKNIEYAKWIERIRSYSNEDT